MNSSNLKLFLSHPLNSGGRKNALFSTTPKEITEDNVLKLLRFDHTTIRFKGGRCMSKYFEYATAIPFSIDNNHSESQTKWVYPNQISNYLHKFGINHLIVESRSHLLSRNGKPSRPMFQVYLPLAMPVYGSKAYVQIRAACIKPFEVAGLKIKSNEQKIFGFGDNPNAFVEYWLDGLCFDELASHRFCQPQKDSVSVVSTKGEQKIHDVLKNKLLIGELLMQYMDDVCLSKSTTNAHKKIKRRVVFDCMDHALGTWSFSDEVIQSKASSSDELKNQSILIPVLMGTRNNPEDTQSVTLRLTPKMSGSSVILEIEEAEPSKLVDDRRIKISLGQGKRNR